jgi:hypothetical protein
VITEELSEIRVCRKSRAEIGVGGKGSEALAVPAELKAKGIAHLWRHEQQQSNSAVYLQRRRIPSPHMEAGKRLVGASDRLADLWRVGMLNPSLADSRLEGSMYRSSCAGPTESVVA